MLPACGTFFSSGLPFSLTCPSGCFFSSGFFSSTYAIALASLASAIAGIDNATAIIAAVSVAATKTKYLLRASLTIILPLLC